MYACAKNVTIDLLQSLDQQKFSVKLLSLQIDNQFRNSPYPVILSFDQEYRSNPIGSLNKDIGAVTRSERFLQADGSLEPVIYLYASKWRKTDSLLVSFEHICLRSPFWHLTSFVSIKCIELILSSSILAEYQIFDLRLNSK